jgi:hypothetical protein
MFNLEQAIVEWRRQMLAAGVKTPVPLEELESHLREEIERQTKSGSNEAEAFKSAVQKIGSAHTIQNEFEKVEATEEERQWQLVQIMLVAFTGLSPILCASAAFSKHGVASEMTPGQLISILATATSLPLLAWGGRLSYRLFPVIQTKRAREAIHLTYLLPVIFWWIGFLRLILPRYDFTVGQLMVALFWALFPTMGVCIGLLWGIETAARKKVARTDLSANRN